MYNFEARLNIIMGDMSGREFAARLGKGTTTVHQYLKGRTPPADFIVLVCERFGVEPRWLLTGEGAMKQADKPPALCREDRALLVQAVAVLESLLQKKGVVLDPDRRGKMTVKLFENLQKAGVSPDDVELIETETVEMLDLVLPG